MINFESAFCLKDQLAIITGGGTGIGRAITEAFVSAGAKVVIAGRRREPLEETSSLYRGKVFPYVYDITHTEEAPSFMEKVEREVGTPTILVNNAGIHLKKKAEEVTAEEFRRVLETHIVGAHALSSSIIPVFRKIGGGSILYIASMASLFGIPYVVAYSAAKSAMLGVVRTLAVEYGGENIRVNAVAPGWIETEMSRKAMEGDPERKRKVLGRTPLARFGIPEDIGWAAVYLCSPAARFITGTCLAVDGGISIGF
ncbi:MAG: SDR family oxidoreductase [Spirochaetales bacterium]